MRRFDATTVTTVILPTLLVASFGLFMTAVVHRQSVHERQDDNQDVSMRVADSINRSFGPSLAVARGVRAFWLGSEKVEPSEFDEYAGQLYGMFPDILAVEWVDAGNVVRYVYPADGVNAAAIDFDNNRFPNRLKPIMDAKAAREPLMTRPVLLAQGSPGVVIYDPIFRGDEYLGAAVVVMRINAILERLHGSLIAGEYDILIESDGILMTPARDALFLDGMRITAPDGSGVADAQAPRWPANAGMDARSVIVAGRLWSVIATPKAASYPVTVALGIVTVGMTALCSYIFTTIRRTRRQLELAVSRERDFTSLVSHQLRAPLTELNWMTDVLSEPDTDANQRAETLRDMRAIVRQGVRTVNTLLSISRIERGVLQIKKEDLPVATIVDDALVALREAARAKGVTFNIDVASEHAVFVDPTQAVEALRNMVDNAVKYGPARRAVTITSRKAGGFVEIDVMDHGNGVAEEIRPNLFSKATARNRKGTTDGAGLGLYLTKMLAELMGGSVAMRGKPGETVFTLRLPSANES